MEDDTLSELLIAQLIEEDLRSLRATQEAEAIQLNQVVALSAHAVGQLPVFSKLSASEDDQLVALGLYAEQSRLSSDAVYAQQLQRQNIADMQYAQKVAATEKKLVLDSEFARRLQAMDDDGEDMDEADDVESVLGRETIENLMASDLNAKGKGKPVKIEGNMTSKHIQHSQVVVIKKEESNDCSLSSPHSTCGICMDPFQPTFSPYTASLTANSSSRVQFGLHLPCPQQHAYCVGCLTNYIDTKLNPDGKAGVAGIMIFPIRCPECPTDEFADGIPDDIAARVIGPEKMVIWDHQKLLHSIPYIYCPNPKCSAIVQTPEETDDEDPQAVCPFCQLLMCVSCRVAWHRDLSCEEFQALPPDERSPEDRLLMELAKAKHWRRCPNCSSLVELVSGCNHMTCRCGTHFCFKCGAPCTNKGLCTRSPPCDLWDEDMLLEEREREREQAANVPAPAYAPQQPVFIPRVELIRPPAYIPAPAPVLHRRSPLEWMDDPDVVCSRHWFTTEMINTLICGYCNVRLNSLADLRFHLTHVRRHPVYACCGRFFKHEIDYDRHVQSYAARFHGDHVHQMRRD
ncbi:RBR-type E3 ubiquitin transferase [Mycena indigotica]|uniref:RBR-type E3 ubiquitin transferase n=1 Tax=Mycena indigotica TaxID=2126181 RepID=A0A8H6S046_9AGAR|nr:RBR-type E3 ubiquitin transferase [Mycena indigotica]KAF7289868.1 RBR-type E3 ubiquitin transferase [Mycena indigotica]